MEKIVKQAENLIKKLSTKYPQLEGWKVVVTKHKGAFGNCNYRKKEIGLSGNKLPICTDESVFNTITHEIAHAIVGPRHNHDYVWMNKHIELGGSGERCGDHNSFKDGKKGKEELQSKIYPYVAICSDCGEKYYRARLPKRGRQTSCGHCSRVFDPNKILMWKRNI